MLALNNAVLPNTGLFILRLFVWLPALPFSQELLKDPPWGLARCLVKVVSGEHLTRTILPQEGLTTSRGELDLLPSSRIRMPRSLQQDQRPAVVDSIWRVCSDCLTCFYPRGPQVETRLRVLGERGQYQGLSRPRKPVTNNHMHCAFQPEVSLPARISQHLQTGGQSLVSTPAGQCQCSRLTY
jgi:hypothetical protein